MICYKTIGSAFAMLCFCMRLSLFAQAPVIIPKNQPIVLKLDAGGNYTINSSGDHPAYVTDLATVTNTTDSTTKFRFTPNTFDCSTTGPQTVTIAAATNGVSTPPNPDAIRITDLTALCFDPAGNLYFGGASTLMIRKITPDGTVSIFAGGPPGIGADVFRGTAGTVGRIPPGGMVCDDAGNVFFSDVDASKVKKISPDGTVTDINKLILNPGALTIDKQHNIYVVTNTDNVVYKITADGVLQRLAGTIDGDLDGPGKLARFHFIYSIAADDAGYVYVGIVEFKLGDKVKIKRIAPDGTVSTYFDPGKLYYPESINDPVNAFYIGPTGLKFDRAGNLFIGDGGMIKILDKYGKARTFVGHPSLDYVDGTGAKASFGQVCAIDMDPCGNLFVVDQVYNRIRKVTLGTVVSTVAGGGANQLTGNIGSSTCQQSAAVIPVNVQSTPAFTSAYNDIILQDCANLANYVIKASVTDNCPDSQIKITQTPAPNSPIYNNVPVQVTLTAVDKTGGVATASFMATAKYSAAPPGRSVSVSTPSLKVCAGNPVTFTADVINGDPGTSFQWLVNDVPTGPNDFKFTTSNLKDGDMVNCAVTTGNGCGIPNLGLDLKMNVNQVPAITLNPKEEILSGNSVNLTPVVIGNIATYTWTPSAGLSDPASAAPVASPEVTTTYKLNVVSVDGCATESEVTVKVIPHIVIPNTFTPNGDGINDLWSIKYLDGYTTGTVTVYNRNGAIVFQSKGYPKAWDGTFNGKPVPTGVYYYVIDLKDGSPLRSGDVSILR
ncbi:gliding motility-associated C-terminal domain-containing protein [Mucilaginibacter sp. SMC90]|uniref:T9SS type B sorting domain-containing protein n=1 Tax=Mucilaginibacter sp. SMC90 TaxID=2929803 RepID=UPI001FB291F1|nr:gliding motility-associated C-terminal domain-containing protein [Mucilaginibacter sp. SMC90]UOE49110.1 gliding motility-associated C-terminal domain-containing protein [Mucilaginibacter sp. SMC90]